VRHRRRVAAAMLFSGALGLGALFALEAALPFSSQEVRRNAVAASRGSGPDASDLASLPPPVMPAFVPGKPVFLRTSRHVSRWAVVRTAARPRLAPRLDARALPSLSPETPEGTTNIVLVLDRHLDDAGRLWIKVRLPALEAQEAAGWIRREALGGYGTVRTRLVVDLDSLKATLLRDGRPLFRADVGVGQESWPTPRGEFYIRNRLTGYVSPAYGPIAFGTSARSRVLTDWPAGGFVGIHGTDQPDLLPGRVSHGCIRMRNDDISKLARLMPVGTPVTIR
jgi:hypothetical protein